MSFPSGHPLDLFSGSVPDAYVGMLGEQINRNGERVDDFVNEMDLESLNETMAEG